VNKADTQGLTPLGTCLYAYSNPHLKLHYYTSCDKDAYRKHLLLCADILLQAHANPNCLLFPLTQLPDSPERSLYVGCPLTGLEDMFTHNGHVFDPLNQTLDILNLLFRFQADPNLKCMEQASATVRQTMLRSRVAPDIL
jgi:hypothetical protein